MYMVFIHLGRTFAGIPLISANANWLNQSYVPK